MTEQEHFAGIFETLVQKSTTKFKVYDTTLTAFNHLKQTIESLQHELNQQLEHHDPRLRLEYSNRATYEAQLKVAGDVLVFSMHSNIFEFSREHNIYTTPFAKENKLNTYFGVISIYNFLADSFKYNRFDDLGYLIGRVFINKDGFFVVEGKRQMGFLYNNIGQQKIDTEAIRQIVLTAIQYSLDFDLLVPPYDNVKIVSVGQMAQKIESSRIVTGKRLGFRFNSDDVGAN